MKKPCRICLIALMVIAIAGFAAKQTVFADDQPTVWRGSVSDQKEPFIQVAESEEVWSGLWKRAFHKPAPPVDFHKSVVACVFLGHSANWLYSIYIGDPELLENRWVIPYGLAEIILELTGPFKASGQYAMKVIKKKKDAPMILEKEDPSWKIR
jgi:hypothetical protein